MLYHKSMQHIIYQLAKKYPQILLPVRQGERSSEEYRNVCLRGEKCEYEPQFSFNEKDKYENFKTKAGEVEVITIYDRKDFIHMAQCLACKCEPEVIPDSTGAMAIFGLNNWEKVRAGLDNYKDSIILLSSGYYSNVSFEEVNKLNGYNLTNEEWIEKSIIIRKHHELTHFIMRKIFPNDINAIRDELIADCLGQICAFGYFDKELLKLFLGIEGNNYREGGRLQNYEGGDIKNIPSILTSIDELEKVVNCLNSKDIYYIWDNIDKLMKI